MSLIGLGHPELGASRIINRQIFIEGSIPVFDQLNGQWDECLSKEKVI